MTFDILSDGKFLLDSSTNAFDNLMKEGFASRKKVFGNDLFCFSPTGYPYKIKDHQHSNKHNFASLSVTGTSCSLHCEHCDGKLLHGMDGVLTPDSLLHACQVVKERGGEGVLISGGSDARGYVPLGRFAEAIRAAKQDLGLYVVVHTGLVEPDTAMFLGEAGIDAAMLDVIGSPEVAKKVYHLDSGPQRMAESLDLLKEYNIPIAPHVLVGLDYGQFNGELEALDMIAQRDPQSVVIIALSPLRGTPMAGAEPPTPEMIGRIMTVARLGMKETPLLLGCARPIGNHKIRTDEFAVKSGVNGIAYVSQEGVDLARSLGLKPIFKDVCCSLAPLELSNAAVE
ncbi:MAG: radical SAM protein [Candidatus Thorarchaeota archaeon]|nr:radical SAM protein [Candidatus Thorarchaeota archaeon]